MKIRVAPAVLNNALGIATSVAPARATLPALSCVKLTARGGKSPELEIAATDLEFGIKLRSPLVECKQEGTLVVPAAKFAAIVREVNDADFEISSDGPLGAIRTSDSRFKLVGLDPADYPALPDYDPAKAVTVAADAVRDMVRKTEFAVSLETVRYALTGQLLELREGQVRMVASDGKRLSYVKNPAQVGNDVRPIKVIVPTKTTALLVKTLTAEDKSVGIELTENSIRFGTLQSTISSRLIDGTFPDYEAVIPKSNDRRISVDREPLLSALRRASLLTQDKARAVKFSFSDGKASLFARSQELGEASVDVPVEYKGESFDIVFNPDYVADYAKSVTDEKIELWLRDRTSAGLFKSGGDYVYILMPLAIEAI
jgi:DNA polymerase-3 subunit beta